LGNTAREFSVLMMNMEDHLSALRAFEFPGLKISAALRRRFFYTLKVKAN